MKATKIEHLSIKFRSRVKDSTTIFVFKSRRGITPKDLNILYDALCKKAGFAVNFVHVRGGGSGGPAFEKTDTRRAAAYIDRFYPYLNADDFLKISGMSLCVQS